MIYIYIVYMFMMSLLLFLLSMMLYFLDYGIILEWLFMSVNSMNIEMLLYLDWVSILFVSIVLLISSMVCVYSVEYMSESKYLERYYYLVLLFVMSMILMILSPNLISIMFGWDGLGLISFCLVVYYQNLQSYNSGMLTVLVNRLGDVLILMVIGMMMIYGSWNMFMLKKMKILMFFLMLAGMTKSAQMPFSSWLPSAMAAPTPVSALVHSSTLVTAGVFLMIRFSKYMVMNEMNSYMLYISVLTMFMSGFMANFEFDLKKIIALSTLSQLGLMMMILSMGFSMLSYYHLLTHAIFKSLLFMSAGIIIHSMSNNQDIRMMGGLKGFIPFTLVSFLLTLLSLSGFPFFSGFYSKDLIMEFIYSSNYNCMMFIFSLMSLMFTVMYSLRLMYYVFLGSVSIFSTSFIYESKIMVVSMIILIFLSVTIGSLLNWLFFMEYNTVFLSMYNKLLTFICIIIGVCVYSLLWSFNYKEFYYASFFISSMWFLNYFYSWTVYPLMKLSNILYFQDKVWMEFFSQVLVMQMFNESKNNWVNLSYKIFMFMFWFILILLVTYL